MFILKQKQMDSRTSAWPAHWSIVRRRRRSRFFADHFGLGHGGTAKDDAHANKFRSFAFCVTGFAFLELFYLSFV